MHQKLRLGRNIRWYTNTSGFLRVTVKTQSIRLKHTLTRRKEKIISSLSIVYDKQIGTTYSASSVSIKYKYGRRTGVLNTTLISIILPPPGNNHFHVYR